MAPVATASEIQVILRTDKDYSYISNMIPIAQDTIDRYFGTDFDGTYPVALKRPVAILIKQSIINPAAIWRERIGDDEIEYRDAISLEKIFAGLEDLIASPNNHGVQTINLRNINTDLG